MARCWKRREGRIAQVEMGCRRQRLGGVFLVSDPWWTLKVLKVLVPSNAMTLWEQISYTVLSTVTGRASECDLPGSVSCRTESESLIARNGLTQ